MLVPKHVAIILDGNRRFAKKVGKSTIYGHKKGAEALEKTLQACLNLGIKELTVFAFSTENFKRRSNEVDYLMKLMVQKSHDLVKKIDADGYDIVIKYIGNKELLPSSVQKEILQIEEKTRSNSALTLNVCVSYGGRSEIVTACKQIAREVQSNKLTPDEITEDVFTNHLQLRSEPDLIIRTSEQRLSNFLPWQGTYAEIIFLPDLFWPEFNGETLKQCVDEFSRRKRRFGK